MRHPRVWFAAAPPGGPRINPAGYYRPALVPAPWNPKTGTPAGYSGPALVRAPWNAKAGNAAGAPTGAVFFLFRVCSARPPLAWGKGKETGSPAPDQSPGVIQLGSLTFD